MGDADGSYDFREAVDMVGALIDGADLCMGSRFKGGIKPGAMPWKNRYIGNPLLTGLLNILFGSKIDDAHCGLRALTRDCFERLALEGDGMEFASEMVIKAVLKGEIIAERPATLSPDLRDRPPHLRPWRDGWRHLRYLFMLSPWWVFTLPAMVLAAGGFAILGAAGAFALLRPGAPFFFGDYWVILAGALVGLGHLAAISARPAGWRAWPPSSIWNPCSSWGGCWRPWASPTFWAWSMPGRPGISPARPRFCRRWSASCS
jgi:hypothetical protein